MGAGRGLETGASAEVERRQRRRGGGRGGGGQGGASAEVERRQRLMGGGRGGGGQGGASAEVERSEICSNAAEGVLVSRAGSRALVAGNTLHHNGVKAVCVQHGPAPLRPSTAPPPAPPFPRPPAPPGPRQGRRGRLRPARRSAAVGWPCRRRLRHPPPVSPAGRVGPLARGPCFVGRGLALRDAGAGDGRAQCGKRWRTGGHSAGSD